MNVTRAAPLLALVIVGPALAGCITIDPGGTIDVRVIVSHDFGTDVRTDRTVDLPAGASAIDALRAVATVETSYGGAFVQSVDGDRSGHPDARLDWFVEHNGVHAPVGGADVTLRDGDAVQWDYRAWDRAIRVAGLLTTWPRPLTVGWDGARGTVGVVADEGLGAYEADVRTWLAAQGVDVVDGGEARHTVLVTTRPLQDVLAPSDPARAFVDGGPEGLVLAGDVTLSPPWGLVVRGIPHGPSDTGDALVVLVGSGVDGLQLLIGHLEARPPNAGIGVAVNATISTVVPP